VLNLACFQSVLHHPLLAPIYRWPGLEDRVGFRYRLQYQHTVRTHISTNITIGPSLTGLRGTQLMGSIIYTLVTGRVHRRCSPESSGPVSSSVCLPPRRRLTLTRTALRNPSRGSGPSMRMRWSPLPASPPASIRLPHRPPRDVVLRPEQIPHVPLQPPASTSTLMSMLAPVGRHHRRNPGANDSVFFSGHRGYLLPR
jgi:hypothetical protein